MRIVQKKRVGLPAFLFAGDDAVRQGGAFAGGPKEGHGQPRRVLNQHRNRPAVLPTLHSRPTQTGVPLSM